MQEPWISAAPTLLAVFEAVRENGSFERSSIDRRTGSFRQGWTDLLFRVSPMEAAMLQDLTWWGPRMEDRLKELTYVQSRAQPIK